MKPEDVIAKTLESFIRKKGPIISMDIPAVAGMIVADLVAEKKSRQQQEVAEEKSQKPARQVVRLSGATLGDPESAIEQALAIIEMCEEIPTSGQDFAQSVADKCADIAANIERNNRVTEAQQEALDNMEHGVQAWLHD